MARFARLENQMRDFQGNLPPDGGGGRKPVVILLHGLGGDRNDWISPFRDRNWPYDHRRAPAEVDLGTHDRPPLNPLPGVQTRFFLSPRLAPNRSGVDGSDDRSWWQALVRAGFPVFTYSQVGDLMLPFSRGPVAEFKSFMEALQQDVLGAAEYRERPVIILGHSRGGLIGRAYLSEAEVKADQRGRFPRVRGLVSLCSPHHGSHMALMDDKIIGFLSKVQQVVPKLPNDVGNSVIESLKAKADAYVGAYGDEIEPDGPLFGALRAQEPIRTGVRCLSVGGTSPRLLRVYVWTFTRDSLIPKRSTGGKLQFRWRAQPVEAKGASPVPDGLPLKLLGMDLDEIMPGRGDGLTADRRCRFPATFSAAEHLSFPVSHAEALWDPALQQAIIRRLGNF